MELSIKF